MDYKVSLFLFVLFCCNFVFRRAHLGQMPTFSTIITLSLMATHFSPFSRGEHSLEVDLDHGYCSWRSERSATCVQTEIIMKLNIVQGLYIVLTSNTNSRKIQGFHRGGDGVPVTIYYLRPTLYHNYILRIYLKNNNHTNPLLSKDYETITMSYNYDN